jgi:hypothetical protein
MDEQSWQQYPTDRFISDMIVGMSFVKRKHRNPTDPIKKYYGNSEMTGEEIAKYVKTFDLLGHSKNELNVMTDIYEKLEVDRSLASQINDAANMGTKEYLKLNS